MRSGEMSGKGEGEVGELGGSMGGEREREWRDGDGE